MLKSEIRDMKKRLRGTKSYERNLRGIKISREKISGVNWTRYLDSKLTHPLVILSKCIKLRGSLGPYLFAYAGDGPRYKFMLAEKEK